MPFTVQELSNISSAALDFHMNKGKVFTQSVQDKPLLAKILGKKKTFPGGKGNITVRVKGVYTTTIQGFTHDDTVSYANPANIKTASFPWKEIHAGIQVTMTELKNDGVSVVDTNGAKTSTHSDREMTMLANLLEDKLDDMTEGMNRGFNTMFWGDGTTDTKLVPGIQSFVTTTPTAAGIVGGIDQAANTWWQNRVLLNIASNSGTWANQPLILALITEFRQLKRFGGAPNVALCGSSFLDALVGEMRAKGFYTQTGWKPGGTIDVGAADATLQGVDFLYDPTLDDLGFQKRAYVLDFSKIRPMVMDGEDMKEHNPSRPEDKYVIFKAMTWTGGLVCQQRNCHGVYSIA